jgi:diguanylate cyclase (GGDEF)-like protein/PAS domain S-box-containing protein
MREAMANGRAALAKAQQLRMQRLRLAMAASAATVLMTMLVALAGYLPWRAGIAYAAIVATCSGAFYALLRTDGNLRLRDPTMSVPQLVAAGIAVSYLIYESDVTRAVFMAMYAMAFMFGMFTLGVRGLAALAVFYVACDAAAIGLLAQFRPESVDLRREVVRILVLAIMLVWMTILGHHVNGLRRHLTRTNGELGEALRRYQKLTEMSSDWYWEQDASFRFTRIDGGLLARFGIDPADVLGRTRWEAPFGSFSAAFWEEHVGVLERHQPFRDFEIVRRDASERVMHAALVSGEPIFDEDGAFRGYRGVGRDITERKRMEETVARMAAYDELTGLPNARLFGEHLARAVAEAQRARTRFAVLYCDLDGFKPINDELGHRAGDALLGEVATRLAATRREADVMARLGGDEFAALATNCATAEDAERFAERICAALRSPLRIGSREARITCSVGIALYPDHGATCAELLDAADGAMYAAKKRGPGRYQLSGAVARAAAL